MSQEDKITELTDAFKNNLCKFSQIWDKIGICEIQRKQRLQVVMDHIENLLDQMLEEEEGLYNKLVQSIEVSTEKLIKLSIELDLPVFDKPEGLTVLQLEKELRNNVDALVSEKQSRLKKLKKLTVEDQGLCDILCITPYYIPSGKIPSVDELKELENHIATVKSEKEKRVGIFRQIKEKIIAIMEDLSIVPEKSFDQEVVFEPESSFVLSTSNMQALEKRHDELQQLVLQNKAKATELREQLANLWDRLQIDQQEREAFLDKANGHQPKTIELLKKEISRCEELKCQNIKMYVEKLRCELRIWWEKCLFGDSQKDLFRAFHDDSYSEDLLDIHDLEIQKLKSYFEENKDLIEKVTEREELWAKMLEFEKRAQDPDRFNNRGGGLLQEEKERKKLLVKLPKLERELEMLVTRWEEEHGKAFLVNGSPYKEHVRNQQQTYQQEKEKEKIERQKAKAELLKSEMITGSRPTPSSKRRFIGTPSKTPTKVLRLTPGSQKKIHSSLALFHSPAGKTPKSGLCQKFSSRKENMKPSSIVKRGILTETTSNILDHSTISGNVHVNSASVASTVDSYSEFSNCINRKSEKDTCRSSAVNLAKSPLKVSTKSPSKNIIFHF